MERQILSVQETNFKQDDGTSKSMWKLFCADDSGNVGCIYSNKQYTPGEYVTLGLVVNRDGRFMAKIIG